MSYYYQGTSKNDILISEFKLYSRDQVTPMAKYSNS